MSDNRITIQDSACRDWTIVVPRESGNPRIEDVRWAAQVTAPLPLEAINDLFLQSVSNKDNPLLPSQNPGRDMTYVTEAFFQSKKTGISPDDVKSDVLGFFSLVLTFAKKTTKVFEDESPKNIGSIMPRTDFTNIYKQIQLSPPGSLYDLLKVLACYKYNPNTKDVEYVSLLRNPYRN